MKLSGTGINGCLWYKRRAFRTVKRRMKLSGTGIERVFVLQKNSLSDGLSDE